MPRPKKTKTPQTDAASEAYGAGYMALATHPIFSALMAHAQIVRSNDGKNNGVPSGGWAVACADGTIRVHPTRRGAPGEWTYVLAHCLLHLAFDHFRESNSSAWNGACDAVVARFLHDIQLGRAPDEFGVWSEGFPILPGRDEIALERAFLEGEIPASVRALGTANGALDMEWAPPHESFYFSAPNWPELFSSGLSEALDARGARRGRRRKSRQTAHRRRTRQKLVHLVLSAFGRAGGQFQTH